jgi:hypothetical protein
LQQVGVKKKRERGIRRKGQGARNTRKRKRSEKKKKNTNGANKGKEREWHEYWGRGDNAPPWLFAAFALFAFIRVIRV